ncbi:MAG TPA: NAD(P)-dependent oxidoreductase, partial [Spirochaetia bacterium]|nr:NAD(P)-dependent oxidoreductase [Spirochaetia bacterium]
VVLGAGVVGTTAAQIAVGMGADVTVIARSGDTLRRIDAQFDGRVRTVFSTAEAVEHWCRRADLLVGAVLVPGAAAPKLVSAQTIKAMKRGAVLVDVAIDQGGCAETSKPTTHDNPIYIVDGVVHYCVANMPGAVARSSTIALTSVTLPYGLAIANQGLKTAAHTSDALKRGINTFDGKCVHPGVAKSCGLPYAEYAA